LDTPLLVLSIVPIVTDDGPVVPSGEVEGGTALDVNESVNVSATFQTVLLAETLVTPPH
jgi:hypothetical protein